TLSTKERKHRFSTVRTKPESWSWLQPWPWPAGCGEHDDQSDRRALRSDVLVLSVGPRAKLGGIGKEYRVQYRIRIHRLKMMTIFAASILLIIGLTVAAEDGNVKPKSEKEARSPIMQEGAAMSPYQFNNNFIVTALLRSSKTAAATGVTSVRVYLTG
ncbi:hypothetical protein FOZ63_013150, partial [Perkinsus olseni]